MVARWKLHFEDDYNNDLVLETPLFALEEENDDNIDIIDFLPADKEDAD